MLRIFAESFVDTGRRLSEFQATAYYGHTGQVAPGDAATIAAQLTAFLDNLEPLALPVTSGIIRQYKTVFEGLPLPTYERARACAEAIENSLKMELGARLMLQVSPEYERYLLRPLRDWVNLRDAFPDTANDVGHAGACYALEQPSACVFHLMRAAEHGVRALHTSLGLTKDIEKCTWGDILTPCENELRKVPADRVADWRDHDAFFREVVLNLRALQKTVRDPTMHVQKVYEMDEALAIYNATRAFMLQAAQILKYP